MDRPATLLLASLVGAAATALGGCASVEEPDPCSRPGVACTWAGVRGVRGYNGEGHDRRATQFTFVADVSFAPDGRAWIADLNNHRVRVVEDDDSVHTMIGNDTEGDGAEDGSDLHPLGDPVGAPGPLVSLNHPTDVEFLDDGTVVVAAWHNNKIRVLDPGTGVVKVLAGDSFGFGGDGGPAAHALFDQPKALATDGRVLYLVDQRNQRIRMLADDPGCTVTTIVGSGVKGDAGDGGPALEAELAFDDASSPLPNGALVLDGDRLYVADSLNRRIRVVDLVDGTIEPFAGNGERGSDGDGGPALDATFVMPLDLELGPDGRLYVVDTGANVVRAIDLATGVVERVAGNGLACDRPLDCLEPEEGLPATEVQLSGPYGIAFDAEGALYVADTYNSRVVRVSP